MNLITSLQDLRYHGHLDGDNWNKLLKHLNKKWSDKEPLELKTVLDVIGLDDTVWCSKAFPHNIKDFRRYGFWCVSQVQDLLIDPNSIMAFNILENYINDDMGEAFIYTAKVYSEKFVDKEDYLSNAQLPAARALNYLCSSDNLSSIYHVNIWRSVKMTRKAIASNTADYASPEYFATFKLIEEAQKIKFIDMFCTG